ncbi:hypothetical protein CAPTEDRAFT_211270 [Capitella teleta]|uniref:RAMA domain-containing protein n=1 Tax=Capitella teleta TaxID=283909 RepID=R7TRC0_CAPTE|nr:hypothetical protein CAPTEDRAFT_211270 [Capitella teleta]|eukprot:ELT93580.1 hypothetical protein CAPTEDRAFT_211270 [Capitella teleta]
MPEVGDQLNMPEHSDGYMSPVLSVIDEQTNTEAEEIHGSQGSSATQDLSPIQDAVDPPVPQSVPSQQISQSLFTNTWNSTQEDGSPSLLKPASLTCVEATHHSSPITDTQMSQSILNVAQSNLALLNMEKELIELGANEDHQHVADLSSTLERIKNSLETLRENQSREISEIRTQLRDKAITSGIRKGLRKKAQNLKERQVKMVEVFKAFRSIDSKYKNAKPRETPNRAKLSESRVSPLLKDTMEPSVQAQPANIQRDPAQNEVSDTTIRTSVSQHTIDFEETPRPEVEIQLCFSDKTDKTVTAHSPNTQRILLDDHLNSKIQGSELPAAKILPSVRNLPKAPVPPSIASTWSPPSVMPPQRYVHQESPSNFKKVPAINQLTKPLHVFLQPQSSTQQLTQKQYVSPQPKNQVKQSKRVELPTMKTLLKRGIIISGTKVLSVHTQEGIKFASVDVEGNIITPTGHKFVSPLRWAMCLKGVGHMKRSTAYKMILYQGATLYDLTQSSAGSNPLILTSSSESDRTQVTWSLEAMLESQECRIRLICDDELESNAKALTSDPWEGPSAELSDLVQSFHIW